MTLAYPNRHLQLFQVAKGLKYLHGKGIVHGDLKAVCPKDWGHMVSLNDPNLSLTTGKYFSNVFWGCLYSRLWFCACILCTGHAHAIKLCVMVQRRSSAMESSGTYEVQTIRTRSTDNRERYFRFWSSNFGGTPTLPSPIIEFTHIGITLVYHAQGTIS